MSDGHNHDEEYVEVVVAPECHVSKSNEQFFLTGSHSYFPKNIKPEIVKVLSPYAANERPKSVPPLLLIKHLREQMAWRAAKPKSKPSKPSQKKPRPSCKAKPSTSKSVIAA